MVMRTRCCARAASRDDELASPPHADATMATERSPSRPHAFARDRKSYGWQAGHRPLIAGRPLAITGR